MTSNVSILYPNIVSASSLTSSCFISTGYSMSAAANGLLNEFIYQLSDDPVYDLSFKGNQATWTYDVDSDITYEANVSFTFDINGITYIRLNIYEGYTPIDTMYFERLESTNGFTWVEIDNVNLRWEQDDKLLNKQTI